MDDILKYTLEGVNVNLSLSYKEILSKTVVEGMNRIDGLDLATLETE